MRSRDRSRTTIHKLQVLCALGTGNLFALLSPAVHAEPSDDARNLFREGRALSAQGYYQAACAKFEKSLKIESGSGTEFNLAECLEKVGRTATARRLYLKVAQESQTAGLEKRAQLAFERADHLLTRVPRIQLQCDGNCPLGIQIFRDGVALADQTWTEPIEVDPGTYRVQVPRGDKSLWTAQALVSADPSVVIVAVPVQSPESSPPPTSKKRTTKQGVSRLGPASTDSQPALAPQPRRVVPSQQPQSFGSLTRALLYTGAGGLVFSGGMALWFNHKNGQAQEICPSGEGCSSSEIAKHDRLVSDTKLLRAGIYGGLGLAAISVSSAGLLHYFGTSSKGERQPGKLSLRFQSAMLTAGPDIAVSAEGNW